MMNDLFIRPDLIIPLHELEITASRAGGAGGQHVNKTSTRITVRWNILTSTALSPEQKALLQEKLQSRLTAEGDLIIHNSTSRSQQQNKKAALTALTNIVRQALHVPKKRLETKVSQLVKESRLRSKSRRSMVKKMRRKKIEYD